MSGTLRPPFEDERAFYHAYGAAMANWANLEYELGNTFIAMTKMAEQLGREVFFSARSFLGRADMFETCIPHIKALPVARTFLLEAVTRARTWQGVRNKLAHEMHAVLHGDDGFEFAISPAAGGKITKVNLERACENFYALTQLVQFSRGRKRLVREPELCAEALVQIPTDALADVAAHTRITPLLRRIQACDD